jgi:hypothetical protein
VLGAEEVPCFLEELKSSSSYSSSSWFNFPAFIVVRKGYHSTILNPKKDENFEQKRNNPDEKLREKEKRKIGYRN